MYMYKAAIGTVQRVGMSETHSIIHYYIAIMTTIAKLFRGIELLRIVRFLLNGSRHNTVIHVVYVVIGLASF